MKSGRSIIKLESYLASSGSYDLISFDFFDTLFYRQSINHIRGWKAISTCFAVNRIIAEILARLINRAKGIPEVRFEDIYKFILPKWNFEIETEFETRNLRPNTHLREKIIELVANGKKVIVISDTHFTSNQLSNWMTQNGFPKLKVFTSQDYLITKSTGLFDQISQEIDVAKDRWLHVGDNMTSDFNAPSKVGIRSFHYPKLLDQISAVGLLSRHGIRYIKRKGHYGEVLLDSLRCNFSALRPSIEDNEDIFGYFLGNQIVSPISHSIATELNSLKRQNGSEIILYSSRDGWIPYLLHAQYYPEDSITYFKTSRAMSSHLAYKNYVENLIEQRKSIVIYDLGWRGTTVKFLRSAIPDVKWIAVYSYLLRRTGLLDQQIMKNTRKEQIEIWRARDLIEAIFPDPSSGYYSLDSKLSPLARPLSENKPISDSILTGVQDSLRSEREPLPARSAGLLIYCVARFPSYELVSFFRNFTHDIHEGEFTPLITDSWNTLFSQSRVMWPRSARLISTNSKTANISFIYLVRLKEIIQRLKNVLGRLIFKS